MRILALIVAAVTALVSIAAFFGESWWVLDLVANFRVQMAVVSIAVLLLVAFTESLPAVGMAALALLLNAGVVLPLYLSEAQAPRPTLTVASFNLLSTNDHHGEVLEWIADTDADVVFLHEGTEAWEEVLFATDLPYDVVTTREPHFAFGTIALVPEGAEVTNHGFARTGRRAVEVTVNRVTVIGIHPLAPISAGSAAVRDEQIQWAAERARSRTVEAMVIGDFNATPWSWAFRRHLLAGGLTNTMRGYGPEATWQVGTIGQIPIDNAVITDRLAVYTREVGPDLGSDHLPIVVTVGPRTP